MTGTKSPYPDPHNHLVVANVSGGKDSTALSLHLTELGISHRRVFSDTGWEHPDTYRYLDRLERAIGPIDRVFPLLGMAELIRKKAMFPRSGAKYCTRDLKITPINKYMNAIDPDYRAIVALGIRADESAARAGLGEWELGGGGVDRLTWRPLIAWKLDDVIAIHARHGIEPNPLYLRGALRVGCWPCIYSRKAEIRMVASESPERIDEIEQLEIAAEEKRQRRLASDPEYAANAELKQHRPPTYFMRAGNEDASIRSIVEWSKTSHGGKQYELFEPDADAGCMRWGLCDHPPDPPTE